MKDEFEKRAPLALLGLLLVSPVTVGQIPPSKPDVPSRPAGIDATYVVKDPYLGQITVHLHDEEGKLIEDEKSKSSQTSFSVEYEKINFVQVQNDSLGPNAVKRVVSIRGSDGNSMVILLSTELEAKATADYVGRQASLELIGDAWRVRKPFKCPSDNPTGCLDFKELLDHNDPDIVESFYTNDENSPTYACFNDAEREFFIISYTHFPSLKSGWFHRSVFKNGQSSNFDYGGIDWSMGSFGQIRKTKRGQQKPETVGSVDASSLTFEDKFTNKMNTTTEYTLNIRWSTGRYTENLSGKDEKGKTFFVDYSGICVKLN